ncbi:MAG: hypothetical protein KTR25_04380 [Myxococcales bacterium]|nr:hypothetical protein [Myxococcales bacterium]
MKRITLYILAAKAFGTAVVALQRSFNLRSISFGLIAWGLCVIASIGTAQAEEVWFGTAPFCKGSPGDCTSRGMDYVRSDKRGDGRKCWRGRKVLCRRTTPPVNCSVIQTLGRAKSARIRDGLNSRFRGFEYRINRRKTLRINSINSVAFNRCRMTIAGNVTLKRRIRQDGHGTI